MPQTTTVESQKQDIQIECPTTDLPASGDQPTSQSLQDDESIPDYTDLLNTYSYTHTISDDPDLAEIFSDDDEGCPSDSTLGDCTLSDCTLSGDPDLAEVFSEDDESSTCTFCDHSELLSDEEEDSGWSSGFSTTTMSTPLGQTICSRVSALMDLSPFNSPGSIHYKPGDFTISNQVHLMTSTACVSQCKDCDGSCQEDSLLPAKALDQLDLYKSVSDESTTEIPVSQNVQTTSQTATRKARKYTSNYKMSHSKKQQLTRKLRKMKRFLGSEKNSMHVNTVTYL